MKKFILKAFSMIMAFALFAGAFLFGNNVSSKVFADGTAVVTVGNIVEAVQPGSDIQIPVTISNNPGFVIGAFDVEYDSNALSPQNPLFVKGSSLDNSVGLTASTSALLESTDPMTNITVNGEILKLCFTVNSDVSVQSTVVSLKLKDNNDENFCNADDDLVPVSFVSGTISLNVNTGSKAVTFYGSDLETSIDTLNVAFDSTLENSTLPTVAAPEGKVFAGWYTSKPTNDGAKVTPNTVLDVHDKVRDNFSVYPVFIEEGNEVMLEAADGSISACSTFKAAIDGDSPVATSTSIIRLVTNVSTAASGSYLYDISSLTYFHVDLNGHNISGDFNSNGPWDCYIFKMEPQLTGFTFENTKSEGKFSPSISNPQSYNGVFGIPSGSSPSGNVEYTFSNVNLTSDSVFIFDSSCTCTFNIDNSTLNQLFYNSLGLGNGWSTITAKLYSGTKYYTGSVTKLKNKATWLLEEGCGTLDYANYSIVVYDAEHYAKVKGYDSNGALTDVGYVHAPVGGTVDAATLNSLATTRASELLTDGFTRRYYTFAGWTTTENGSVVDLSTITYEDTLYPVYSIEDVDARAAEYNGEKYMTIGDALQAAIDANATGQINIKLIQDSSEFVILTEKTPNVVIDLNGKTLSLPTTGKSFEFSDGDNNQLVNSASACFAFIHGENNTDASLTIKDNSGNGGCVYIGDYDWNGYFFATDISKMPVSIQVNIEGGNFVYKDPDKFPPKYPDFKSNHMTASQFCISGGTFKHNITSLVDTDDCDYSYDAGVYTVKTHIFGDAEFAWSNDRSSCIVKRYCTNDGCSHCIEAIATITSTTKTNATCISQGVTTYTANITIGGNNYSDTKDITDIAIDSNNHDIVHHDAKAATCEAIGWDAYDTCSRCSYTTYVEKSALNHDYKFVEFVWDGFTAKAKYVCENDSTHIVYYNATITNEVTTTPTCVATGVKTYTATYDGHTATKDETLAINSDNHDIDHHDAKAATCEAIGWDAYDTCSRCDYSTYVEITATNHNYVFDSFVWDGFTAKAKYVCENDASHVVYYDATITNEVTTTPTCVATGVRTYTATYEGHTDTKDETLAINPDNHDIVHHNAQAATCEAIGWDAYDTCSRCDYSTYVEIPATNHSYVFDSFVWDGFTAKAKYVCENDSTHIVYYNATITNEVTTTPTCVATGVRTYTATYEGHTDTKDETLAINPDNHDIVHHNAQAATCEAIGWDAYDTCSRCDYSTYVEIPATNHSYVFDSFVWDGYTAKAKYVCENDSTHIVYYDATVTNEVTTTPTCVATGVKTYTATYDGHTDTKNETLAINPDNHDIVHHDAKAATCETIGWDAYDTCSRCSYTTYVEKSALNHDYKFVEFVWDGFTAKAKYVCENDSTHIVYYNATITNEVTTTPTCVATGVKTYTATYDGHTDSKDETLAINPDNHDIVHHDAKAPDCTNIGWDAYDTCSRCSYSTYVEKAALGHKVVIDPAVPATTISTGLTEGAHCSVCKAVLEPQEVVDKLAKPATGEDIVDVVVQPGSNEVETEINSNIFDSTPAEEDNKKVVIKAGDVATIEFDSDAAKAISENADGAKISISIEKSNAADKASEIEAAGVKGAKLVISFELTANDNPVFGVENANGQAVVSFEYTPSNICAQVLVYYINGNERIVVPSELKDGKLYFTASHFSDYVIAEHETHEYHDGLCECGGVAENVKFYFEVSSNNTVSLVVYDDYGAVIRLPLDGSVNTESVLIKAIMQNVSSLDVDGVKSHEITVNTGFGSKTVNLQTWLSNAYNFDGATLNISIDGHELTYTFASIDANNGIVASTDTDAARTAWQSLTSHITTSTQTEDDSFIEIANGSFLKIGTEYLRFEDGYVGNLKLDNFSDLDALETAIRAAVTLDTCADQGGDITLFVKAGTKIAVGQTVAELQDDYMIIISADPDEMDAVDGSLASLKDASGSYETVKELVSLFNKVIGVVDACNSVEVEMHVHEFTHVTANDASCTEDGNIEYWFCENCGKYYSNAAGTVEITSDDTVIGALGHTLTHVTANAPTCVDDGNIEYWYCSECEKYFTDAEATTEIAQAQTVVDALDHDIIHHDAKAPTCTDIGWDAYDTCSRCEYSTYVEKSATNHDYKFVGFVWDGFTAKAIYVCENDADHVVFYDATVTNEVTTTPTCVATGVRTYTATYDGHTDTATETLAIDSDNHNIVHIDAKSPTCTEAGWEAYDKCSRCDYSTKTEIPATNHDYKFVGFVWDGFTAKAVYVCENDADHVVFYDATVTDEVTLTPTCTCIGVKTYTASYDGNTDTKLETLAINPDNHDIVGHNGKAPTCTEDGWHGYDTCSRCDYSTKVVIPATNHNYKFSEFVWDGFTAKAKYVCENDSSHVVYYDAIVTNEVTLTPTCDSTGTKKYTATYDGNEDTKLETLAIDPNNHNIEHHNSKAPDCTTIGWDAYDTCSRCEYSTYVEKSALGHTLVHTYAHDADCHATGNIEFWYCSVCEKYFSDAEASTEITQAQTVIAIKPHTPATEVKENEIAPTCKTTGSYDSVIYCSECHDQISRTTMLVTTTSHNTIHFEGKDATVYSTGNIEYWYCCECKEYFSDSACLYGISKADIEIAKLTATEVTKPTEDTTSYVYNGSEQTYVIADSDKYTVYGNKQTNAGTYTVTVSLKDKLTTCWTGGSIDDLTFSFTIAKTTIDMSGVTFESDALVADGQYHSIYVNGLPINVQVSYSNNNIKNPGTYKIVASFTAGENYNAIPDMEATLTILAKSDEKKTISSNGNSVEGYLPEGSSLDVEVLDKATSEDAKVASTLVENQKNVNAKDVLAVLEVNLSYKGIEIQPNGEIKLTLKVPTSVGDNSFAVYHVHTNEDGTKTVTALDHELNGDKFSVTVDKLSQLVLVKAEATPSENNIPLFFMIGGGAIVLAVLVALIALGVNKKAHRICKSALESEKAETQEAKTEDNN